MGVIVFCFAFELGALWCELSESEPELDSEELSEELISSVEGATPLLRPVLIWGMDDWTTGGG